MCLQLWPDVLLKLNFDTFYSTDYNLTAQTTDKKEGASDEANEETILNENQSGNRESYDDDDEEYDGNTSGLNINEWNIWWKHIYDDWRLYIYDYEKYI